MFRHREIANTVILVGRSVKTSTNTVRLVGRSVQTATNTVKLVGRSVHNYLIQLCFIPLKVLSSRFEYISKYVILWREITIKKTNLVEWQPFCSCVPILINYRKLVGHHVASLVQLHVQKLVGCDVNSLQGGCYHPAL